MPRGRAATYAQQREAILQQAAQLFAQKGYRATTMQEVAQASGVSKPTLYHYVRDKDELLLQIAKAHVERLEALVQEVQCAGLPPAERLRELVQRFVHEYAHAQHQHRVLTEDVRFLGPREQALILGSQRRVVAAFAQTVTELHPELAQAGLSKPLTMLLFGMINWMFTWLRPEGPLQHADMAPLVADLFVGGLGGLGVSGLPQPGPRRPSRAPA
jgi:AcrR family transcriptional regulator